MIDIKTAVTTKADEVKVCYRVRKQYKIKAKYETELVVLDTSSSLLQLRFLSSLVTIG